MADLACVSVSNRLTQLTHKFDAGIEGEVLEGCRNPEVETIFSIHTIKEERRPALSLDKIERLGDAVVPEILNNPELSVGLPPKPVLLLGCGREPGEVHPHPTR